jgi:hypothetical protein
MVHSLQVMPMDCLLRLNHFFARFDRISPFEEWLKLKILNIVKHPFKYLSCTLLLGSLVDWFRALLPIPKIILHLVEAQVVVWLVLNRTVLLISRKPQHIPFQKALYHEITTLDTLMGVPLLLFWGISSPSPLWGLLHPSWLSACCWLLSAHIFKNLLELRKGSGVTSDLSSIDGWFQREVLSSWIYLIHSSFYRQLALDMF